jgi:hypothetical protein
MNPLPLLCREFQVALRRPLTFYLRLVFGGGSMLLAIWSILVSATNSGAQIFAVLIAIGAVLSMAVAVFGASDSISRERREGTLGFLFLTDLQASDVVLGKISAAGLVPFYTLLSMFPAFAVCVLVGGVPIWTFWKGMAALMVTLLFSLSATLCISSFCEDHRKAFGGAALLLLVVNPLFICRTALRSDTATFLLVIFSFCALTILFFYTTAGHLQRHWRDPERSPFEKPPPALHRRKASALIEKFPVAWMMLRRRARSNWAAWLLASCGGILVAALAFNPPTLPQLISCLWVLFAAHLAYEIILLMRTAYAFYSDRRTGALELMVGSRLSNEEIFSGFNSYLLRKSAPVLLLIIAVDVIYGAVLWFSGSGPVATLPLAMGVAQGITLAGIGWLGVYRSLMMNHPSLAMLATFARLSLLPVALSLLFLAVPNTDFAKVAAFYIFATGFLAVFFSLDAKAALAIHGRALLLRPATEAPPHIESEWSFIDWEEAQLTNLTEARPQQAL